MKLAELTEFTLDLVERLNFLADELEHTQAQLKSLDFLRSQVNALKVENEVLRDLIYELGITCSNPENMSVGAVQDIRRALEAAGVL